MKPRRLLLPIVLVISGVVLLHGCIYIPTFNKHHSGVDASKQVGGVGSRNTLRVGSATRADVERVLGPPRYVSADGNEVAYTWLVQSGVWLSICFGSNEVTSMRAMVLTFDGDLLRSARVEKNPGFLRWMRGKSAAPPAPSDSSRRAGSWSSPARAPATGSPPPPPAGPTYTTESKTSP
jgi:hypothetical protein